MADIDAERLRQLNERSRFYTIHIWQVPFAYVAVIAWAIEKVPLIQEQYRGPLMIGLGIFSLSVLVFVIHMKYYERRAVKALQDFEQEKEISGKTGGANPWYMSFAWYIRLMLLIAVVTFFLLGILYLSLPDSRWKLLAILLAACSLAVLLAAILIYDRRRSRELIRGILERTDSKGGHMVNQDTPSQTTTEPLDAGMLTKRTGEVFGSLYLTLVSIVQGVAFAFLMFKVCENSYLFPNGYQIATFLIIILVTLEYMTVTTFFRWPLSLLDILIPLGLGVGQVLPLAHSENPEHWWKGVMFLVAWGIVGYLHSIFMASADKFKGPHAEKAYKVTRGSLVFSLILCFALLPLSLFFASVVSAADQNLYLNVYIGILVLIIIKEQCWCWMMYRIHGLTYR